MVSTLLYRCFQLTSTSDAFHREVERLRGILARNAYPLEFVDHCIAALVGVLGEKRPIHSIVIA